MNAELLRQAHPHVQEEWARMEGVLQSEEAALREATERFLELRATGRVELAGRVPADDAPQIEWEDYFIVIGTLRLQAAAAGVALAEIPGQLALGEVRAA